MTTDPKRIELLAPAGGRDALHAAVANGADAVYLGVERFNARRGAENFTVESLPAACDYAHLRGVRVYLTMNTVILPGEMGDALETVARAYAAGVDAVIVQDLGLMQQIAVQLPEVRLHASTQMNTHNSATIRFLAGSRIKRVTLAREVPLTRMPSLVETAVSCGVELECFAHGALCMSYSGQCLLSSLIGGRSANRGACAQPCRLPYELAAADGAARETPGRYLLSPRDLATVGILPSLIAAGVRALKIEGRAKSAEYVATVTGVYRAALDRALADPEGYAVRKGEMRTLEEAFSRGFTTGHAEGRRGADLMSYRRPNNRGVAVGRVAKTERGRALISLDTALESEDTIEVWTRSGRFSQRVGPMMLDGREQTSAPAGTSPSVRLEAAASAGDRVFRVANAALLAAARRTFADASEPRVPVRVSVRAVIGEPLTIGLVDGAGHQVEEAGDIVEPARTRAVTAEDIVEHVGRFGGSSFRPDGWEVELSPGAGLAFAELHRVRRGAVESLEAMILGPWKARTVSRQIAPSRLPERRVSTPRSVRLVASAVDAEVARAALEAGADEVQLTSEAYQPSLFGSGVVPVLERIAYDPEFERMLGCARSAGRLVVGNLGFLAALPDKAGHLEAHWSLNVTNPWSCSILERAGVSLAWASPELNGRQLAELVAASPIDVGTAVWGAQELMVTEQCVLAAQGSCSRQCAQCPHRRTPFVLRDRKGYEFPVITDTYGRSHVYNAVVLDLLDVIDRVLATGVSAIRVDLATNTADEARAVVQRARRQLALARDGVASPSQRDVPRSRSPKTTAGHFFRGVT